MTGFVPSWSSVAADAPEAGYSRARARHLRLRSPTSIGLSRGNFGPQCSVLCSAHALGSIRSGDIRRTCARISAALDLPQQPAFAPSKEDKTSSSARTLLCRRSPPDCMEDGSGGACIALHCPHRIAGRRMGLAVFSRLTRMQLLSLKLDFMLSRWLHLMLELEFDLAACA